jgi:putative ABC transport system permease protein
MTIASCAMGVSVFFAMHAANQAVSDSFQDTVLKIAGATELQISAGETGFSEDVLERVQALDEVAAAVPVIEAVAGTGQSGQGNLLILGVDLTGDRVLRDYQLASGDAAIIEDPLVFLAQPDSIIVTSDYARRNALEMGNPITLDTAGGARQFTVRGVLQSGGFASAFGGNLAVMDVYAAQQVFGRGRRFDRIDVILAKGTPLLAGGAALRAVLGPGFQVQPPATRGQSVQSMLRSYSFVLNFSSAFALVVAMFIIYSSFSVAVIQRRKEIGILRALGATRGQIATLFLGESAMGGLIGSAAGLLAGYAASRTVARAMAGIVQGVYGALQDGTTVTPSAALVVLTIAIGILTSVVAAGVPARDAAKVNPIQALQKGNIHSLPARVSQGRVMAAFVAAAAGSILLSWSRSMEWFYAGYLCVILAALLLTPMLARALARLLRPVMRVVRPVEGALAADNLIGSATRTASTVSALMLSLALAIGLAGMARSSYTNIMEWVTAALNADFFVTGSPTLTDNNYRLPDSMFSELVTVPGVDDVYRVRTPRIQFGGQSILLVVVEMQKRALRSPPKAIAGNPADMYRLAANGQGVIGSENLASLRGLKIGDPIELPTPKGVLRLPLVGIVREYGDLAGEVMLDWSLFQEYWNDDTVDQFRVFLKPGANRETVRSSILRKFSGNRRLFVLSNRELRQYVSGLTNQWFGITWMQVSIAIVVAILGIINSLTVTIHDRRREFGILQTVGAFRHQVRVTIWMEAAGIAVIGLILGLALGAIHLYYVLELTSRDFPGLRFDYMYPFGVAALLFPVILAAALLSAAGPAEVAVRSSLVEALEYE